MSLKEFLQEKKSLIEDALLAVLPAEDARPVNLSLAMRHGITTGGKRLRPVLALAASEVVRNATTRDKEACLNAALAVELFHSYTLIHDDLPAMDNDLIRRGQPTVHAKYGEAMAILAGDALLALAFDVISRESKLDAERALRLVRELSIVAGNAGVMGGQVEDIEAATTVKPTLDTLTYVHQHKTADLFRVSLRLGAIAGGGEEAEIDALGKFGNNLGIAFQIIDDLLDDAEAGADAEPDGMSCLVFWNHEEAREEARMYTKAAIDSLAELPKTETLAMLSDLAEEMFNRVI